MTLPSRLSGSGLAMAAVAVLAAACGGSSGGGGSDIVTPQGSGAAAATVTTHSGPDGKYLTDGNGRTLYVFSADKGSTSTCTGACTSEWPPFTTSGMPSAGSGLKASDLGTTGSGSAQQVTFAGHPLYYFDEDESPGDMNGAGLNDFGGLWSPVAPDGSAITTSSSSGGGSEDSSPPEGWG